jgi:hypothetical protein
MDHPIVRHPAAKKSKSTTAPSMANVHASASHGFPPGEVAEFSL